MNERIKEILVQCQHESIDGPEYPHWTDLEKFAELIVKECRDMFVVNSPSWNLLNEKLEHFGVDE